MRIVKHMDRKSDVLLTGLPGIGRVGHVAAAYLLNKMDSELVADIYSEYFPPQIVIEEKGITRLIRNQLYYIKAERPFFLLTGDSQPVGSSPDQYYKYTEELLTLFQDVGVKEIYTMAGIDRGPKRFTMRPGVVVAGTDEEIVKRFVDLGAKVDESGAITGAAGLLLGLGKLRDLRGACLMGETSQQLTMHGDPSAALAVLEIISQYLGFTVDLDDLRKAAEGLDGLLQKMVTAPKEEQKKEPEPLDYIR